MTTTEENAMDIAGRAALSLIAVLAGQGLPLHLVLIALHAEAVVQTAANYGGEVAADMCDRAARRAPPPSERWTGPRPMPGAWHDHGSFRAGRGRRSFAPRNLASVRRYKRPSPS